MSDWQNVRLGDIIQAKYGKALPQAHRHGGDVPVYGSNGIVGWHDNAMTLAPVIIIGRKGSSGEVSLSMKPCWPIDTTYFIDEPGPYQMEFLCHLLRSLGLTELDRSTAIPGLNRDQLYDISIPVPPMDEQVKITQLINTIVSKRANSIMHLKAARRAIERFRQSVLTSACSGRLTADWRDEHSPAESTNTLVERSRQLLLATRSRRQLTDNEALAPDWLVLPDSWQWASLANLAEIRGGIQKQPKRTPKRNAFPYLRVANVHRGQLDLSEIHQFELQDGELEIYRLEPGDLLVVEGNGSASEIGRCALWNGEIADCVHQNHIIRVRCVEMEPRFVELYWNSPLGSREIASLAVTSSGLYSLSTKKIGSVPVPVAPLEEQREVVRRVHALLNIADRLQDRIEVAVQRVERCSQAVLVKAFRGELTATASEKQNAELVI